MNREAYILCNGAEPKGLCTSGHEVISLSTVPKTGNVKLQISDISERLMAQLPDLSTDLLEIASCVYSADQLVTRGGEGIANQGVNWRRDLHFFISVRQPSFWSKEAVKEILGEALSFLSEDAYSFDFYQYNNPPKITEYLFPPSESTHLEAEVVLPFSGGLDSLAGAVQEIFGEGKKAALVSHRSAPKIASYIRELNDFILNKQPAKQSIFVPVWVNKSLESKDYFQRSRSFLYASLAATIARVFGLSSFKFYENGVTSINLPIAEQVTSTRATRSTHPRVLRDFAELFSHIADSEFKIEAPFIYKTKTDILEIIRANHCEDLICHSRSCSHTIKSTKEKPHCGRCSQCIDRRFAVLAAGLGDFDPGEQYSIDLLTGPREIGDDRTMVESISRLAVDLEKISDNEFFNRFPQIFQAIPYIGKDSDYVASQLLEMYRRHAKQLSKVIEYSIKNNVGAYLRGELPNSCLIVLAMPPEYKKELPESDAQSWQKPQHSEDFRSVTVRGESYTFTPQQAQVVQILWEHWERGVPEVGHDYIMVELGSRSSRLRDTFKKSPAWGKLIIRGQRKGTYRLNM